MSILVVIITIEYAYPTSSKAVPMDIPVTGNSDPYSFTPSSVEITENSIYLPIIQKGKAYYVATAGDDANSGTVTSPWRTLNRGVNALMAGDTLYIKSGTYVQTEPLIISSSGNPITGPITISTAPGEASLAVITGDTNGDGTADTPAVDKYRGLVEIRGSYLQLNNLEIAYSKGRGILSGGIHNVISGSNVHHIWNNGIYVFAANNLIDTNSVWRTAESNYCNGIAGRRCNGGWPGGIVWGAANDSKAPGVAPGIVVRNNRVFNISGEAIACLHTDYGLIEGNVVYDNWASNVALDQCSYTTIQKNLIYYTNDTVWWKRIDRPASGILLENEGIRDHWGNSYPVGHDRKVTNNILVGNGFNFDFWYGDGGLTDSALVNDLIANNTLIEPLGVGGHDLRIDPGPHINSRVINNLFLQSSGMIADVGSTSGITFANNLWSLRPTIPLMSDADVLANPLLEDPTHIRNPGSVQATWYKLSGASPAIDGGIQLIEVIDDYWNAPRNTTPDIGAHQYIP